MINAEELIKYFSLTEEERNFGMLERLAFIQQNGLGKFNGTPEEKYHAMRKAVETVQNNKALNALKKYYVSDLDDTCRAGVRVKNKKDNKMKQLGKEIVERPGVLIAPTPIPTALAPLINKAYRAVKSSVINKTKEDGDQILFPPVE